MIRPSVRQQAGFTLVELTTAMVISAILILSFSSVIIFSRKELTNTAARINLSRDQVLFDRYVRTKLTSTVSDSMKIYPNSYAESIDSSANSGVILRSVSSDSTKHHLSVVSGQLLWVEDSIQHTPVDAIIHDLTFTERKISSGKSLLINLILIAEPDTMESSWSITLRN